MAVFSVHFKKHLYSLHSVFVISFIGGLKVVMEPISIDKAKKIANNKGLKPGKVKGTEGVQFTKGKNSRLDVITWDEFEAALKKRKLAIYESGGWMKIMKA